MSKNTSLEKVKSKINLLNDNAYEWRYCTIGGVTRVMINSGEDIAHLGELDQKLWTVLSCPTSGLEFPQKTLQLLDTDNDGKIRVNEIVAAANWLCSVLKDRNLLVQKGDSIPLSAFNTENEEGLKLYNSARQILKNLGLEKDEISIADTSDSLAIFASTRFNGDGIITPASTDDENLKKLIESIIATIGSNQDRSGEAGINADQIEAFYTACAAYKAWKDAANSENLPFGENTEAALEACNALRQKIEDYFMRCKMIAFNEECSGAVDVSVAKIEAIGGGDMVAASDEIATYPLARPNKDCLLNVAEGINPVWQAAVAKLRELVLGADKQTLSEAEWNEIIAKFDAYTAWKDSKAGAEVESLGDEYIFDVINNDCKADLTALIEQDNAVADEANSIDAVDKLVYLRRDFFQLLKNYVVFEDFFTRKPGYEAIFQAGQLYIDQRCLDLCIRVSDMSKHTEMAGLSGMYLIYCTCTSKVKNQTMDIVAVLTDGDIDNMRAGKNAIFYDREGQDWDAVVTKIVDNPISIRQAFFSPYRKLVNFITDKINKSAAEKEAKSMQNLTSSTDSALTSAQQNMAAGANGANPMLKDKKQAFDIAKFAGIFAAIGMALGMIGQAIVGIIDPWYNIFILLAVLMICTSGPSVFIAWSKLRKRNLGPILNANGWAINSNVLVNTNFGATLTHLAKYPKLDLKNISDPFADEETPWWKKLFRGFIILVVVGLIVLGIMLMLHVGPFAKYYNLTVQSDPSAEVTQIDMVKGGGEHLKDMKLYEIEAVADTNLYRFIGWSDLKAVDGSDTIVNPRKIQLNSDTTIIAKFEVIPQPEPDTTSIAE